MYLFSILFLSVVAMWILHAKSQEDDHDGMWD
jgi:hypothetical protein